MERVKTAVSNDKDKDYKWNNKNQDNNDHEDNKEEGTSLYATQP